MPRQFRIECEGAIYRLLSRATGGKPPIISNAKSIVSALTTVILIGLCSPDAIAQTGTTDEQLLRKLIQENNEGKNVIKRTEDSIFVSGAYPRPIIGRAVQEALESRKKDRLNEFRKGEVMRLVISQSGDMAEEFGNFTLSFDQPDKQHISFDGSYLRVWRKVKGKWLEDAYFARPNEPEEETKQKPGS
jgi:ketosteroid isomerase-like protein